MTNGSPLRTQVESTFRSTFGRDPEVVVRAPGRVNLLGGHVDYHDGFVLPGAIDHSIWIAAARGEGRNLRLHSLTFAETRESLLGPAPPPPAEQGRNASGWVEYPLGVAWALERSGFEPAPLDAVIGSDLAVGAGVSSSAALEVAFLLTWNEISQLGLDRIAMAKLGQTVENDYLDVQSGIMDQFASLHGKAGHVLFLECRTLESRPVPLPDTAAILIADSAVRRRLVEGGINNRRTECKTALDLLRQAQPSLRALRDVDAALLEEQRDRLGEIGYRRVKHVVEECARVQAGALALQSVTGLEAGRGLEELGELMCRSHLSSRDFYEVSIPELDTLAEAAWEAPGCYGARLSGAGFGGCVAALVDESAADSVSQRIRDVFSERFGHQPEIHRCRIDGGAEVVLR